MRPRGSSLRRSGLVDGGQSGRRRLPSTRLALAAPFLVLLAPDPATAVVPDAFSLVSLCLASQPATAPHNLWTSWSLAPEVVLPLLLVFGLYAREVPALRGRPGVRPWQAACFAAGWLALVVALVSPLCRMAATLASAHMVQHVVLVAIALPLLLLAAPLAPLAHGLPRRWREWLAGWAERRPIQTVGRGLGTPMTAGLLYGAAIWLWHAPLLTKLRS